MPGLVRGTVALHPHDAAWDEHARLAIALLKDRLGDIAVDIQHAGSTAIPHIKAKPIIDIVVGINDFDAARRLLPLLAEAGVIHRPNNDQPDYMMFVMGDMEKEIRTHHIHVVPYLGEEWNNQLNFRDYLNAHPEEAERYEALKMDLMHQYSENRGMYTKGKEAFIKRTFVKAARWRQDTK